MQSLLFSANRLFEKLPSFLRRWRWLVVVAALAFTAFAVLGLATRVTIDMSPEIWFKKGAPAIEIRDRFRAQFGSDEGVFIAYRPKSGDVFSEAALKTLVQLHRAIEDASIRVSQQADSQNHLSRIERIDSLYNARYQIAEGDTLISKKLIGADFPVTGAEREKRRAIADSQESFRRVFYSSDYQYGAIQIKTDFGAIPRDDLLTDDLMASEGSLLDDSSAFDFDEPVDFDPGTPAEADVVAAPEFLDESVDDYAHFMAALKELTQAPEYSDFEFYYSGNPVMMEAQYLTTFEAGTFLVIMVVMIMVVLWVLFQSFSAVLWPLLAIILSLTWALGFGAWLGISYSSILVLTVMLTIAVGIASCVHVMSAYRYFRREGNDHAETMALAYRKTGFAILLTSVTTMIGMLSLTLADMPAIQVFGFVSALAVAFSFVFVILLLPVLLDFWHPNPKARLSNLVSGKRLSSYVDIQSLLAGIAQFSRRYAKVIVLAYLGLFLLMVFGATQVKVDSNFVDVYKDEHPIHVATRVADEKLMGALSLELFLDFQQRDALKDPEVLKVIARLQAYLEEAYPDKVVKTLSLADIVKDTNRVMNAGSAEYERVPDDPRLTAQLLYLFNNANPDDRRNLVSDDYSKSHITIMLRNGGSAEYTDFFANVQQRLNRDFEPLASKYPDMDLKVTGVFHLMMELTKHISWTQLKSFGLALLSITALMMITLGSRQAGLMSMLPNLLPALFTFGVLGYLGIPLTTDMLIIAPIIIGIAVDDTIHFITHYRNAWYEHNDVALAVGSTLSEVGQAVILTTLVLAAGFGILGFSDYLGLAKPGVAGAVAIVVALLSDLLFLPALIQWLKPDLGRKRFLRKQNNRIFLQE